MYLNLSQPGLTLTLSCFILCRHHWHAGKKFSMSIYHVMSFFKFSTPCLRAHASVRVTQCCFARVVVCPSISYTFSSNPEPSLSFQHTLCFQFSLLGLFSNLQTFSIFLLSAAFRLKISRFRRHFVFSHFLET